MELMSKARKGFAVALTTAALAAVLLGATSPADARYLCQGEATHRTLCVWAP